MDFPELLYALTLKDTLGAPVARRVIAQQTGAAAATTVSAIVYTHPDADTVAIVMQAGIIARPGAAQNFLSARMVLVDTPAATELAMILGAYNNRLAVALEYPTASRVFCPVFLGDQVRVVSTFDAGAAVNTIIGSIIGWIIPRGTLQR